MMSYILLDLPDASVVILSLQDELLVLVLQDLHLLGYLLKAGQITCSPGRIKKNQRS
jgi:hypothetical protein